MLHSGDFFLPFNFKTFIETCLIVEYQSLGLFTFVKLRTVKVKFIRQLLTKIPYL
jgi:hypothetical protein